MSNVKTGFIYELNILNLATTKCIIEKDVAHFAWKTDEHTSKPANKNPIISPNSSLSDNPDPSEFLAVISDVNKSLCPVSVKKKKIGNKIKHVQCDI